MEGLIEGGRICKQTGELNEMIFWIMSTVICFFDFCT